jgi:hypothetical protein
MRQVHIKLINNSRPTNPSPLLCIIHTEGWELKLTFDFWCLKEEAKRLGALSYYEGSVNEIDQILFSLESDRISGSSTPRPVGIGNDWKYKETVKNYKHEYLWLFIIRLLYWTLCVILGILEIYVSEAEASSGVRWEWILFSCAN